MHNQKIMVNQNLKHSGNNTDEKGCLLCGDIGWKLSEEIVEEYDPDPKALLNFADFCPKCRKRLRTEDDMGMPKEFHNIDLSKFGFSEYQNQKDVELLKESVQGYVFAPESIRLESPGLYLYSRTPGSGKTRLACAAARSLAVQYDLQCKFISVTGYIAAVQASMKSVDDPSKIYRECAILVLDDLGSQKTGEWQDQEIFRLIDTRNSNDLVTIVTSNMCPGELNLEQRTISRFCKLFLLAMPEESIRDKQSREYQAKLLKLFTQKSPKGNVNFQ